MWLSLKTIQNMVDISDISPEDLALKLTMSTAEIESVEYMNHHFKTIYTAKAQEVTKHPDADKLTIVQVAKGEETMQVVCGASNHKSGDTVALATVGTTFTEEFTIKKSKIRGAESAGMLCSSKELGLSEDHSGIIIFPEDTPLDTPLSEIYPDWVDTLLEIDNKSITHRPDLWSHTGFAREIGALYDRPVTFPWKENLSENFPSSSDLKVDIQCPDQAPRYSGLVMKNIKIEESPQWLQARVTAIGMRPISNIVDITNYVMAEVGEPMHAFDRKKLKGDTITIRLASEGEKLTTLDGQDHDLTIEDVVIADGTGAIALAGVMGGGNSEIDDSTSEIVLEAANFDAVSIRKTAHRYNLRTEAAARFEKSLSPELTTMALIRCYELIKEVLPESEAVSPVIDSYPGTKDDISIDLSTDYIRKELGEDISDEKIITILTSLGFVVSGSVPEIRVEVPYFRATKDVSIPADIVEEIGRIYGYDNITPRSPLVPCEPPVKNSQRLFERDLKSYLTGSRRMMEVSGYSFTSEELLNRLGINDDKELRLANPLSSEQDRLRRSLVPNMIQFCDVNRKNYEHFAIFEVGRVYIKEAREDKKLVDENRRVAGLIYHKKPASPLFYDAKGAVKGLMEYFAISHYSLEPVTDTLPPYAHPGQSLVLKVGKEEAGLITTVHPGVLKKSDIPGSAALFDLDMDIIFQAHKTKTSFQELQKFPPVPFEVSVLVEKKVYAGSIIDTISRSGGRQVQDIEVLSIYEGDPIPEGQKSVSIKMIFTKNDGTLNPQEVENLQNKVIKGITKKGFTLR